MTSESSVSCGTPEPSTRPAPRLARGPVLGVAVGTCALLAAFVVSTVVRPRPEQSLLWDIWVYGLVMVGASAVPLLRAASVRAERGLWLLLGAGLGCYAAGDWLYGLWVATLDPEPYPSWADALWLAFYVLAAVAVLLMLRQELPRASMSTWLDGVIAGLGSAALVAALTFDRLVAAAAGAPALEAFVTLAYPVADLLLLGLAAAAMAVQRWKVGRRWVLLVAGMVLFGVGDTVYVVQAATDSYAAGGLLDIIWPAGATLMAWAALSRPRRRLLPGIEGAAVLVAPLAFAALAVGLLVLQHSRPLSLLSLALAALTVLAALCRVALTVREVAHLAVSRQQAHTDELTGLANRRRLFDALGTALGRADGHVALVLLDLDRFKEINDSLGHATGDEVLRVVADRLASSAQPDDVVARVGGDEFALVFDAPDEPAAVARARDVVRRIGQVVEVADLRLQVAASAGVTLLPRDGSGVDDVLRRADAALYRAKRARTGVEVVQPQDGRAGQLESDLLGRLREGLRSGAVRCHVQPQVDLVTGRVGTVEALVRWQHPTEGLLLPAAFLPAAEHGALLPGLTRCVLDSALAAWSRWAAEGVATRVAVNLSAADLLDVGLPGVVAQTLARHGVPATALELEVTEELVMSDPEGTARSLGALRTLGVSVALDDFGTGRSSLAQLQRLPLDTVKLARPLVVDLLTDPRARAIARTVVDLGRALGLRVVAEGVEDEAACSLLRDLGCHAVQGFVHSRAMPPEDLPAWLAARDRPAVPRPAGRTSSPSVPV